MTFPSVKCNMQQAISSKLNECQMRVALGVGCRFAASSYLHNSPRKEGELSLCYDAHTDHASSWQSEFIFPFCCEYS